MWAATASGTVRSQPVQVATADGNDAVIAGGLAPGMQVVGQRGARAGARAEGHGLQAKNGSSAYWASASSYKFGSKRRGALTTP